MIRPNPVKTMWRFVEWPLTSPSCFFLQLFSSCNTLEDFIARCASQIVSSSSSHSFGELLSLSFSNWKFLCNIFWEYSHFVENIMGYQKEGIFFCVWVKCPVYIKLSFGLWLQLTPVILHLIFVCLTCLLARVGYWSHHYHCAMVVI